MTEGRQLSLAVHLRDEATLENFLFPASTQALRNLIESQLGEDGEQAIYIHGGAGSGRSHLLQAACHRLPAGEALYLPLEQLVDLPAQDVLADVEHISLVSLDNVQAIAGNNGWEEALFHLINRAQASGCRLIFSADNAPRQLGVELPDLQSRLSWGLVYQLPELTDQDKLQILQFRAKRKGMLLNDESGRYILNRAARSLGELMSLLELLDQASMVAQRSLTIPFIKLTLGW